MPRLNIVVGMVNDHSLYSIAVIVKKEDDGLEMVPDHCREVLAGDLK